MMSTSVALAWRCPCRPVKWEQQPTVCILTSARRAWWLDRSLARRHVQQGFTTSVIA